MEQALAQDPLAADESREAGRRVLLDAPLGITYRVDPGNCTAKVLRVWCY
jgi:hypothetical protein